MPPERSSLIVCDASALVDPDLGTIDALARLQLRARRIGCEIRLRHTSRELAELLAFAGLAEVLCVEVRGQPEEREQRLGLEEERDLADPAV
jgi:hypothetical protein